MRWFTQLRVEHKEITMYFNLAPNHNGNSSASYSIFASRYFILLEDKGFQQSAVIFWNNVFNKRYYFNARSFDFQLKSRLYNGLNLAKF